jgi:hypothetical protein
LQQQTLRRGIHPTLRELGFRLRGESFVALLCGRGLSAASPGEANGRGVAFSEPTISFKLRAYRFEDVKNLRLPSSPSRSVGTRDAAEFPVRYWERPALSLPEM